MENNHSRVRQLLGTIAGVLIHVDAVHIVYCDEQTLGGLFPKQKTFVDAAVSMYTR